MSAQSQEWDPGHREAEAFESGCPGPCSLASIWAPGLCLSYYSQVSAWLGVLRASAG